MPGFCAGIFLAVISCVKLFGYVVDGGNLREPCWGEKAKWGIWPQAGEKSNPQDAMGQVFAQTFDLH